VSKASEPSNVYTAHRSGDGRFARGNPGGPGWPHSVVREAESALDRGAVDASAKLLEVASERARAAGNHEKRIRALEEWFSRARSSS
jgi:hypothetical protein